MANYSEEELRGAVDRGQQQQRRFQQMGGQAANRGAFQVDYGQANADRNDAAGARGAQVDALGMQRQAAAGAAPSRAELLGQQMAGQALNAQLAGAASARGGPLAQAAAQQGATNGAAQYMQQATNQQMAMRAGEMADARNAYMAGASGIRAQDYQGAAQAAQMSQFQGQMEQGQRQLNQQAQMGYEAAGQQAQQAGWDQNTAMRAANQEQDNKDWDRVTSIGAGVIGGIGGLLSDASAKVGVAPMSGPAAGGGGQLGTLAAGAGLGVLGAKLLSDERSKMGLMPLAGQPMGELEPWLPPQAFPADALVSDERSKTSPYSYFESDGIDRGALGAPKGYAASRAGKPGALFDTETAPDGSSVAPGTEDWARYGEAGHADFKASMQGKPEPMSKPTAAKEPSAASRIGAAFKGFAGAMHTSDERAKRKTQPMSDAEAAKLSSWADGEIAKARGKTPVSDTEAARLSKWADEQMASYGAPSADWADTERAKMRASLEAGPAVNASGTGHAQTAPTAAAPPGDGGRAGGRKPVDYAALSQWADGELTKRRAELADLKSGYYRPAVADALDRSRGTDPSAAEPARMMDAIGSGKTFRYREGVPGTDQGAQQHFGTTTQDLKQTPMGASMVKPGPNGYEAIDTREAVGPTLAALGNLNERLRMIEKRGGRR